MTQENTWLPGDYQKPASNSRYLKLQQGDNKIRILTKPITGWLDWQAKPDGSKTPVRTHDKQPAISVSQQPKHFWSFAVWDYLEKNIKVMEITQSTIQDAILTLHQSADWGNPTEYDITIKKTGEKMDTKYFVSPTPPRPLSPEISEALAKEKINLEALYENGDPFENQAQNQEPVINVENVDFGPDPSDEGIPAMPY
jgi:hypothetical protein